MFFSQLTNGFPNPIFDFISLHQQVGIEIIVPLCCKLCFGNLLKRSKAVIPYFLEMIKAKIFQDLIKPREELLFGIEIFLYSGTL